MKSALAISIALGAVLSAVHAADPFDTLIPYPRQLAPAGEPVHLDRFRILVGPSSHARIGANEINQRIQSLGGKTLPVGILGKDIPQGNVIIVATCDSDPGALRALPGKAVTPQIPGRQGYIIRPERRSDGSMRLWLVGSDPLGTLYAAVTTRQLIQPSETGPTLRPAAITDWPDYKKRLLGHPMSEPRRGLWYAMKQYESQGKSDEAREAAATWVARKQKHYDWMLRAKINWAWCHSFLKADTLREDCTILRAAWKQVNDYGLERGIRTMVTGTTSVGDFPTDKDNPDFKDVAYHSSHHRYFCWSRLEYHHRKAARVARMVADCGYRGFYLHAADGGGWRNPGLWNDRCEKCRETYGDDHARADAAVFGIYYDAIRKLVPDCDFAAVVYPYSPEQLDPGIVYKEAAAEIGAGEAARRVAEERTGELVAFVQRLDTLLPPDIFVTVREAERPAMDRMRAAWGKRRFHMYYEFAFWKGWQSYFTTTPLWTRSFHYPEYDDMLYGSMSGYGWREVQELLGAECAWNVNRPGAKDFSETAWKQLGTRLPPPPQRAQFASRAARFWFGEKMGPLMAPVFAENISFAFIANPDQVVQQTDIPNPLATMVGQVEATRRTASSLDKARALQNAESILDGEDQGFLLNMLLMTHGAAITADHRARIMQIQAAIDRADRQECARLIAASKASLETAGDRWKKLDDSIPKKQLMLHYTRPRNSHGYLSTIDVGEFQKEVDALSANYEQQIIERTIPSWFLKSVDRRRLQVGRVKDEIKLDGKLDEATWSAAQPATNFIRQQRLQLESRETQARIALDETQLYVSFECHEPNGDERIVLAVAGHKKASEIHQWVVGQNASVTPTRFRVGNDGAVTKDNRWKSVATMGMSTSKNLWTVELAIPLDELGFQVANGRNCVMQLARLSSDEAVTFGFLHGDPLHERKHFVQTSFTSDQTPKRPVELSLELDGLTLRHETIGSGSGTVIGGDLSLLSDRPLHQFRVSVAASDGLRPLGTKSFSSVGRVPLIWRPDASFDMRFPEEVPGVVARFTVIADEGKWSFTRRFGSPRRSERFPDDFFTEGVGEGKAINAPIHFPSVGPAETPWPEGTIEFWIKPNWDSTVRAEGPRGGLAHALIHMGPIRPDHPTLTNLNTLALVHTASGYLTASITNSQYRQRSVSASVRHWQPGDWHHVAMQWKLNDGGRTTIQLYLDGVLATKETYASPRDSASEPLRSSSFRPPIQIGSMNTGIRAADAAMDELRIRSSRSYRNDFEPRKRLSPDDQTVALFHFEDDLTGHGSSDLQATAGAAQ